MRKNRETTFKCEMVLEFLRSAKGELVAAAVYLWFFSFSVLSTSQSILKQHSIGLANNKAIAKYIDCQCHLHKICERLFWYRNSLCVSRSHSLSFSVYLYVLLFKSRQFLFFFGVLVIVEIVWRNCTPLYILWSAIHNNIKRGRKKCKRHKTKPTDVKEN